MKNKEIWLSDIVRDFFIFVAVVTIAVSTICIVKAVQFQQDVLNLIESAQFGANATISYEFLTEGIEELEARGLTEGETSYFAIRKDTIGKYYRKLCEFAIEFKKLDSIAMEKDTYHQELNALQGRFASVTSPYGISCESKGLKSMLSVSWITSIILSIMWYILDEYLDIQIKIPFPMKKPSSSEA